MLEAICFLIIELFLFELGCLTRNSRAQCFVILFFSWVFVAFTMISADIDNYRYAYNANIYLGKDPLFFKLQQIGLKAGLKFDVYKAILGSIMMLIMTYVIINYSKETSILAALCLFLPCGSFATQIRSGLAGVLVILGIQILTKGGRWRLTKYLLLIFIASGIHQMAVIYLILSIPYIVKNKLSWIRIMRIVVLVGIICIHVAPFMVYKIIENIGTINNTYIRTIAYRLSQMFSSEFRATTIGFLFNMLHHMILFYCTEKSQVVALKIRGNEEAICKEIMLERAINYTLLLIIPLYAISFHFSRILYYAMPFMYASAINAVDLSRDEQGHVYGKNRIYLMISVTLFVSLWGILQEPQDYARIISGLFRIGI